MPTIRQEPLLVILASHLLLIKTLDRMALLNDIHLILKWASVILLQLRFSNDVVFAYKRKAPFNHTTLLFASRKKKKTPAWDQEGN